ncbi:MAG: TolC family protein [Pseudomonadales bacterium]|nr:TolC family protein [Pseudomonadales bacterium]
MRHTRKIPQAIALLLSGALWAQAALAQLDHAPLTEVEGLDFATMLDAALQQAPQALETPVRAQQASDYAAAGGRFLAARPSLSYSIVDDRWRDNLGLRQQDFSVNLPLWRLGERRDAQALGAHYEEQVAQWSTYLNWSLAGFLRTALNDLESAEAQLALERQAAANAEELDRVTQRLFEAGSLAQLDTLQTRNLLLAQQQKVLDAEAFMVDSERTFQILTGLDRRPASLPPEERSPEEDPPDTHPLLRYMTSEVTLARDKVQQALQVNKGNPQLSIGTHSERGDRLQNSNDSVMLSISVPIGGGNIVNSATSNARRDQVNAEVALRQNRIELQRLLHEAEHSLYTVEQQLPLAEEQATLAEQRYTMAQNAFALGELTATQVVSAVQDLTTARQMLTTLRLQRQRFISDYNHLIGDPWIEELP